MPPALFKAPGGDQRATLPSSGSIESRKQERPPIDRRSTPTRSPPDSVLLSSRRVAPRLAPGRPILHRMRTSSSMESHTVAGGGVHRWLSAGGRLRPLSWLWCWSYCSRFARLLPVGRQRLSRLRITRQTFREARPSASSTLRRRRPTPQPDHLLPPGSSSACRRLNPTMW